MTTKAQKVIERVKYLDHQFQYDMHDYNDARFELATIAPKLAAALRIALDELDHHCFCSASQPKNIKCHVCHQVDKIEKQFEGV